ncbi:MAG TPA: hypothetical protein PLD23_09330 [Armatimonadota bacterium]|nr:hypothetical protein [Armatimonadota bacterium]HQK93695.1 hypothetical protein [Armatimonadota bacterium]
MAEARPGVAAPQEGLPQPAEALSPICRRAFLSHAARAALGAGLVAGAGVLSGCLGGYYADYPNYANYPDYANYADYANY